MVDTLATTTSNEGIAQVSGTTEADGTVISTSVSSGLTVGIRTARIGVAEIICALKVSSAIPLPNLSDSRVRCTFIKGPTAVERVSGVAFGARADGLVVLDSTIGSHSAGSGARIDALQVKASPGKATLLVLRTLGVTTAEWVSQEVGRARADRPMVLST